MPPYLGDAAVPEHIRREQREILKNCKKNDCGSKPDSATEKTTDSAEDDSLSMNIPVSVLREQEEALRQIQRQNSASITAPNSPLSRGQSQSGSSLRGQNSTRSIESLSGRRRPRPRALSTDYHDDFARSDSTEQNDNLGLSEFELSPYAPRLGRGSSSYSVPSPPSILDMSTTGSTEIDVDSIIVQRIDSSNVKSGRLSYNQNSNRSFDDFRVGAYNVIGAGDSPDVHPSDQQSQSQSQRSIPRQVLRRQPSESSTITDTVTRRTLFSSNDHQSSVIIQPVAEVVIIEEPCALPLPATIVDPTMAPPPPSQDVEGRDEQLRPPPTEQKSTLTYALGGGGCAVCMGLVGLLIFTFAVDVGLPWYKEEGEFKPRTNYPTPAPTAYIPNQPTTPSPTAPPTPIVLDLPSYTLTVMRRNTQSPQALAYQWLLDDRAFNPGLPLERQYQRFALATLYYATNLAGWKTDAGWLGHDLDECDDWFASSLAPDPYMSCDPNTGMMESLVLVDNGLVGSIPPELSLLTNLKYVDLGQNSLQHGAEDLCFPTQLGALTKLQHVNFFRSYVCGTIPSEIGMWTDLRTLQLTNNQFIGGIPSQVGLMTSLEELSFTNNDISGTIPAEFAVLLARDILRLDFAQNGMTGTIPDAFNEAMAVRKIRDGEAVDADGRLKVTFELNNFVGTMPEEMCSLKQARLDFDCNRDGNPEEGVCGCPWCECAVPEEAVTNPDEGFGRF